MTDDGERTCVMPLYGAATDWLTVRKCGRRASWQTTVGELCTGHRNVLRDRGVLNDDGVFIGRTIETLPPL